MKTTLPKQWEKGGWSMQMIKYKNKKQKITHSSKQQLKNNQRKGQWPLVVTCMYQSLAVFYCSVSHLHEATANNLYCPRYEWPPTRSPMNWRIIQISCIWGCPCHYVCINVSTECIIIIWLSIPSYDTR